MFERSPRDTSMLTGRESALPENFASDGSMGGDFVRPCLQGGQRPAGKFRERWSTGSDFVQQRLRGKAPPGVNVK